MLKLYYAPNTCALASHIALEAAGADYEPVRVDFASAQQTSPEYLEVNPKGRVPALVTERGVLTETPAILMYIARSFPEAALAPLDDTFELARLEAFNSYLCSTVHVAHAHRLRGSRWASEPSSFEDMKRKVPQSVGDAFALIETDLLVGPWVMGEAFSVGDAYLFTVSRWLEGDKVDLGRLPRVLEHRARMEQLPAVQAVLAQELAPAA